MTAAPNLHLVAPEQPEPSLEEQIEFLLIQRKQALQVVARIDAELLPLRKRFAADRGEFLLPSVERLQRELLG